MTRRWWSVVVASVLLFLLSGCGSEDPPQQELPDVGGADDVGEEQGDAGPEDSGSTADTEGTQDADDAGAVEDTDASEDVGPSEDVICTPTTCETLEVSCGSWPDDCGGLLDCTTCDEGNSCEEGVCVAIDEEAPVATIDAAPQALTADTTASFSFSCNADDCEFECSLDGDVEGCTSPADYQGLDDGAHIFRVRARIGEELVGPWAEHQWTVNTAAPTLIFDATPPQETEQTEATFEFSCEEDACVEFECALDTLEGDGEFEPCQSPYTLEDLTTGIYVFNVRGADELGNQAEISYIWEIMSAGWEFIALSLNRGCGITAARELYCWGDTVDESLQPVKVDDHSWKFVATATSHRCGIREDDSLWCWGGNSYGQLGVGSEEPSTVPLAVEPGWSWSQVSAGYYHTCGLRTDGTAWCWGYGNFGLLGDGNNESSNTPVQVGSHDDWIAISSRGEEHSCGLREGGTIWCWGNNSFGQIGDGTTESPGDPVQVGDQGGWVDITAELTHTCALREEGQIYCWGDNESGSLGTGNFQPQHSPTAVAGDHTFESMVGGEIVTCGFTDEAEVLCWGLNNMGQLAQGEYDGKMTTGSQQGENSAVPVQITVDGVNWQRLHFGSVVGCAEDTSNNLWCWGNNDRGAFGNGESGYRSTVPIPAAQVPTD